MQRLPIVISVLCNKKKLTQRLLSIRSCSMKICDDNKLESNGNTGNTSDVPSEEKKLSGFAKAFEKFNAPEIEQKPVKNRTFANLLRYSQFMDLGDPAEKIVYGKIFHIVDNDLYIDFGWKFHCVCSRPLKNGSDYVRGTRVKLMIKQLELSTKFLGATKDLTILEADCILLGMVKTSSKNVRTISNN